MSKKVYVLTSRVETTMEMPVVFSSFDRAYENMEKEYNNRIKSLLADEEEVVSKYIDEEGASIESYEYFEWRLDVCIIDGYEANSE